MSIEATRILKNCSTIRGKLSFVIGSAPRPALALFIGKKNIGGIPDKAKNDPNARTVYGKILKNFKNKKSIQDCAQYHYGFAELTKQLDKVEV